MNKRPGRPIQSACKRGHPFEPGNIGRNGNGSRTCLTCRRDRDKIRYVGPRRRAVIDRATEYTRKKQKSNKLWTLPPASLWLTVRTEA